MVYASKLLINGELVSPVGGGTLEVEDPFNGRVIAHVPAGDAADINRAVESAHDCFRRGDWLRLAPADRAMAMWKLADLIAVHVDELAALDVVDNGMPMVFAKATVNSCVSTLRYYAGYCTKINGVSFDLSGNGRELQAYTRQEPVGVVGAITPWNAPLAVVVNKIAPAIAAGCTVVVKPAEQTPLSSLRFAELAARAELPRGLINIVTGYGTTAGSALSNHSDVDKLTFTGSTAVGKTLVQAAAGNLKRLTLELGGKSPVFVFDDADLERAIPACAMAIFANSGQVCFAGSRLYIQRKRFNEVVERVGKAAKAIRLGSGMDPATQLGPLVSGKQMVRVLEYIESGASEGAELIVGGQRHGEQGYFVEPTVFANPQSKSMRITQEEIFGPVLVAMPFEDLDEVEALANDTPFGLGSGVFTSNVSVAHKVASRIRAGNVWINCYGVLDKSMPFGGYKQSGWGREQGAAGIEAFLETKAVYTML